MLKQSFHMQWNIIEMTSFLNLFRSISMVALLFISSNMVADENPATPNAVPILEEESLGYYSINAGDFLSITVWNEPAFSAEQLLVRPDGFISAPVLGEIKAGGQTISQLQAHLAKILSRYLKDEPTVVATLLASGGSQIFVLGKVNAPGAYPMTGSFDVTQVIAMARGLNSFAAENKILILRRDITGVQHALEFEYNKVRSGKDLSSNIVLKSGDVVLVP